MVSVMPRQIVAMGGAGMLRPPAGTPSLFEYAVAQQMNSTPAVGFLHQASAESAEYVDFFVRNCREIGAEPTVFSLFGRVDIEAIRTQILAQDVIFVGGGNLKSMLALWREWGVDQYLRQAYDQGCVMTGVSAGAICWYEQCVSDAFGPLSVVEGLGWVKGSLCPHFDSEPERRPTTLALRETDALENGWALDDYTAIHVINERDVSAISSQRGRFVYRVDEGGVTRQPTAPVAERLGVRTTRS